MNSRKFPNRKSNRLTGFDYSIQGFYFVTICCKDMQHLFGEIIQEKMILNDQGKIAHEEWLRTESISDNVRLHDFIIMPNHMHSIIEIISPDSGHEEINIKAVRTYGYTSVQDAIKSLKKQNEPHQDSINSPHNPEFASPSRNLGAIIRGYKSALTTQINQLRVSAGTKVWHGNYYEHIIRNEKAYQAISEYIRQNPERWGRDRFYSK